MSLSARPPTPPPSRSKGSTTNISRHAVTRQHWQSNTPDASPGSVQNSASSSSNGARKRVDFSSRVDARPSAKSTTSTNASEPLKHLPPSRDCRSTKSILKNHGLATQASSTQATHLDPGQDMFTMLDSILLQLESADRSMSIDAYANLCGTLKAYRDTPSIYTLRARMGTLLKYIRRDIQSRTSEIGDADVNLVTQALKVLVFVIWNRSLGVLLTDEYRTFVLEQALQAIEEPSTPKAVRLHYLNLLATQDFRPNIMTINRVSRLLDSLNTVTDKVKSNGIVCERLMVYSRLLDQAKPVMKSKIGWIEHLLAGILLPSKDARSKSIALGTKASLGLGSSKTFSSACQQILDRETQDKVTFSSLACRRLRSMVKSNDDAAQVPQIWALVMLLQGGSKTKLEKWDGFKEWLMVIQSCFNCNDSSTRTQANLAWNRLIYVTPLRESTDASIVKMLIKPIASQLERPGNDKHRKGSRAYATSSFCTLLYYALRPSGSFASFDLFWDAFVANAFNEQYLANLSNADSACRMMIAMCWSPNSKIWRENRAIEASIVEPEELPVLDCKWLRSRSSKVMPVFQKLFKFASWGAGKPDQAFVGIAWKHFCFAMGDACRKEVKSSPDILQTISSFLDLLDSLQAIWHGALDLANEEGYGTFTSRFQFVVNCLVTEIGSIPFTEALFRPNGLGSIVPSHGSSHSSKHENVAALEAILQMVCHLPTGPKSHHTHEIFVKNILQAFVESRSSLTSLLQSCHLCASWTTAQKPEHMSIEPMLIWKSSADLAQKALGAQQREKVGDYDLTIDFQPCDVLGILTTGLNHDPTVVPAWRELLYSLLCAIEQANGQLSIVPLVLEPLSGVLITMNTDTAFSCTNSLLDVALTPERWRIIASIFESSAGSRVQKDKRLAQSLQSLASLVNKQLAWCYSKSNFRSSAELAETTSACVCMLGLTPLSILQKALPILTYSLSLWLEDRAKAFVQTTEVGSSKSLAARKLCSSVLDLIKRLGKKGVVVDDTKKLLTAALNSTHQVIINAALTILKEVFDEVSAPEYSSSLRSSLVDLNAADHIDVPDFDATSRAGGRQLLGSQEDALTGEFQGTVQTSPLSQTSAFPRHSRDLSPLPLPPSSRTDLSTSVKRALPQRRHDDSQIHYTVIESSPTPPEPESQALTENQIDVRQRQKAEPAITFSDFRTSPRLNENKQPSTRTPGRLKMNVVEKAALVVNEPSTPTLPEPQTDDLDDVLPSSPTPSSKSQELRLSDIDVPSSPPADSDGDLCLPTDQSEAREDHDSGQDGSMSTNERVNEESAAPAVNPKQNTPATIINDPIDYFCPLDDVPMPPKENAGGPNDVSETALKSHSADNIVQISPDSHGDSLQQEARVLEDGSPSLTTKGHKAPETESNDAQFCNVNVADVQPAKSSPELLERLGIHNASRQESVELEDPQFTSGDGDFLSVSQLEHELNSSATDEVVQQSSHDSQPFFSINQAPSPKVPSLRADLACQGHQSSSSSPRMESRQHTSQGGSANVQTSLQANAEPEILDCIMVDSEGPRSYLSQASSCSSAVSQTSLRRGSRRRSRKRKSLGEPILEDDIEVRISPRKRLKSTLSLGDNAIASGSELLPERTGHSGGELEEDAVQKDNDGLCEDMKLGGLPKMCTSTSTNQNPELEIIDDSKKHQARAEVTGKNAGPQPTPQAGTPPTTTGSIIVANLESALSSLHSGSISMTELRNIENILFEIRVEAQDSVEKD